MKINKVDLSKVTTYRFGGICENFITLEDPNEILNVPKNMDSSNTFVLGKGSNIAFSDNEYTGYILKSEFQYINKTNNLNILEVGSGTYLPELSRYLKENELGGGEFLLGIPGTLGGALRMNAGCYGGNIWENVSKVILMNRKGILVEKDRLEFDISYRNVELKDDNFFISASFDLKLNELNDSLDIIKKFLKDRRIKQPTGLPSCGSVFKNPKNLYAANLVDSLGLKGYRIGGAYISKKHANFIITEKNAKSNDVEELISYIQKKVHEEKNIYLETEVQFIGIKQ